MTWSCQICGDQRPPTGVTATLWCPGCGAEYATSPGFALVLDDAQRAALQQPGAVRGELLVGGEVVQTEARMSAERPQNLNFEVEIAPPFKHDAARKVENGDLIEIVIVERKHPSNPVFMNTFQKFRSHSVTP